MIRKFIDRLLGKGPASAASDSVTAGIPLGERVEYGVDQHKIDPKLVAEPAVRVVRTLQEAGYEAYIVGGAVRDLLVGLEPKDFDVATNATPAGNGGAGAALPNNRSMNFRIIRKASRVASRGPRRSLPVRATGSSPPDRSLARAAAGR